MSRLLVFNPDHEYSLASKSASYSPPSSIRKLSEDLQFLPLIWSHEQDFVLLPSNRIVGVSDLDYVSDLSINLSSIEPWGWNQSLCRRLLKLGIGDSLFPTSEEIENLRRLSHRRISIACNLFMESTAVPVEFFEVDKALAFYQRNPDCYFKMPWSSGGRGVMAARELNALRVREWVSGSIRKQGSVIAEKGIKRNLDFSSLWRVAGENISFQGFSLSISDGRGKYDGNLYGPQELIETHIKKYISDFNKKFLEKQAEFIGQFIAPSYSGLLGIDMVADCEGKLYPCVEINLRRTMGHVALDFHKKLSSGKYSDNWKRKFRNAPLFSVTEYFSQCHID